MINILDKSIYNLIAAGEVVERPASIVKELVENSIDAGATNISVEITLGGTKKIRVSDNGSGIDTSDLQKAFLPHATSKVCTKEDLEKIGTLGFRGEALSSIAAVSRVTLASKTKDSLLAGSINVIGGEMSEISQKGSPDGTYITVEDIFFNTPARAKFLKTPRSETMEINNLMSRMILSSPYLSFKYSSDGQIIYHSDGISLESALIAVYGKNIIENTLKINYTMSDIVLDGYISKPEFSKSNRTYQTLIINNRYVINSTVSKAAFDGYGGFLMKNQYPFYFINLKLPLEQIDVNVHPNKLDVRFSDNDIIYRVVRRGIENALKASRSIPRVEMFANDNASSSEREMGTLRGGKLHDTIEIFRTSNTNVNTVKEGTLFSDVIRKMREEIALTKSTEEKQLKIETEKPQLRTDSSPDIANIQKESIQSEVNIPKVIKKLGELFKTYILIEYNSTLFILDQHAAHERIIYDLFIKQKEENNIFVQDLLVPYVFDVNNSEYEIIAKLVPELNNMGFVIEPLSLRSYKISSVPSVCSSISLKALTQELLSDSSAIFRVTDTIKDKIAQMACKAAVKGGDILGDAEVNALISKFEDNNNVLLCPHGRPIVIKIEKFEIEKWFKRKV